MAKRFKTTYTYKGIEFASASKVVAEKASQGDMKGAYQHYLSSTVVKQMARADMSPAVRRTWQQALIEGIKSENEAREAIIKASEKKAKEFIKKARAEKREVSNTAKDAGMSKKRRNSLKYQMYRKGMSTEQAEEIVDEYIRSERYTAIHGNIENQYASVLDILRDSTDPDVQEMIKKIEDIMEKYALQYNMNGGDSASQMAKELKAVIENIQYWDSLSEKTASAIDQAMSSFKKIQTQKAITSAFSESKLKG